MRNEANFIIAMQYAYDLLCDGTITERAYKVFEQKMKAKYHPIIGSLFSDTGVKKLDK